MPRNKRLYLPGVCYHVVQRGNQQQIIFHENKDFERLVLMIKKNKLLFDIKVYAYCIMSNHFHLLLDPFEPRSLSDFMHRVNISYAQFYNFKYNKSGHVWQGRFRSFVITKDSYLFNCVNYIEHNPVRANAVDSPEEYVWSSYSGRTCVKNDALLSEIIF